MTEKRNVLNSQPLPFCRPGKRLLKNLSLFSPIPWALNCPLSICVLIQDSQPHGMYLSLRDMRDSAITITPLLFDFELGDSLD